MFAIVDIAGFQEKVEKGMKLTVPTLDAKEGASVTFDKVMLLSDGTGTTVGAPYIAGATVIVTVIAHGKSDKIRVTKFKRRKRFHKTYRGHRQGYTEVEVTGVGK
jgi:large subunit ribosomal protein L21